MFSKQNDYLISFFEAVKKNNEQLEIACFAGGEESIEKSRIKFL